MRVMLDIDLPTSEFNAAVRDGSAGRKLQEILSAQAPESVHFTEREGRRAVVLVVDLPTSAGIPALAEPWFLTFNAAVKFRVVMSPADLEAAGLDELGARWGKS